MFKALCLIKKEILKKIKKKLALLYTLNILDVLFSLFLVREGIGREANIIMAPLINDNSFLSIAVKSVIPLILFLWVYHRLQGATENQLYVSNILLIICLIFYVIVNISHVVWFILYMRITFQRYNRN